MALRKGKCYRRRKRSYTRISRFRKYSFIKTKPQNRIIKYDMGDPKKKFSHIVSLVSKEKLQIRHNAIESSRLVINRKLNKLLGKDYFFKIRIYPHHILRENKMLTGAGADRMQQGMQKAFGKPIGLAAQVKKNQPIFSISVDEKNINIAKEALKKGCPRLPGTYTVKIEKIN